MIVSIIIPIYNSDKYLNRCLSSVLNQTYESIEVILVNDGCTDNSAQICDTISRHDSRVKTINCENNGQGIARNIGMDAASGEYIFFVDSDDVIMEDAIDRLLSIAKHGDYDIVCGSYYRVDKDTKASTNSFCSGVVDKYGTHDEKKRYNSFKTSSLFGYVWGKLYKSSFLKKNDIIFSKDKQVFMEDTLFNLKAIAFNPRYYILNEPIYYYYIYTSSSSNINGEVTIQSIRLLNDYNNFLELNNVYAENIDLYVPLTMRILCWAIFKKVQSKGLSFNNIYSVILNFYFDSSSKKIIQQKNVFRILFRLPNLLERCFYSICIMLLRLKFHKLLSLLFLCILPFSKIYVDRRVRN